jgi:hypothetical protein
VHLAGVVHGDISIYNIMLKPSIKGSGLAQGFNLVLNEWAAAIDLNAFPAGQMFQLPPSSDEELDECWELKHGTEWIFEPDWQGLASVLHWLIFGKKMTIVEGTPLKSALKPFLEIDESFSPYWNGLMWNKVFSTLLNLKSQTCGSDPLAPLIAEIDDHLRTHQHLLGNALLKTFE